MVSIPLLLTVLFVLYTLIHNFFDIVVRNVGLRPFPILRPIILFVVPAVISWFVFRSKMAVLFKASFTNVPMAAILAVIGIGFDSQPALIYSLGALFALGVLAYLFITKKSWLYYFSVISISIVMLVVSLSGTEI